MRALALNDLRLSKRMTREKTGQTQGVERRRWVRETQPQQAITPHATDTLKPLIFSNRDLPTDEQFKAWRKLVAPLVEVGLPDGMTAREGFPADHTAWNLGSMLLVQQTAPAHTFVRSAEKLRSNAVDHWTVTALKDGRSWTEVDRRVAEGRPGGVEVRSLGRPFRGRATQTESVVLYLPRELFAHHAAVLDARNNVILSGGLADFVTDFINGIVDRLATLTVYELPPIVEATRDLILAGLSGVQLEGDKSTLASNAALMERARRHVQDNLGAADLSPDSMARSLGISRTRLYQLLEASGGVLNYIQSRRLVAAHLAIADPKDTRRIFEIADAFCFSSAAHFSRAFAKEFGYSPRHAQNTLSQPRLGEDASVSKNKLSSFDDWLKHLGT